MTKTIQVLRSLGPIDFKGVRRDSALPWMVALPIISALFLRWAVPPITRSLITRYGFDLSPYYPVILAYFLVVMPPIVFSVMVGFLLLDEKDDQTLSALQITPLSMTSYLAYRVALPVVLTVVMIFLCFPLANLGVLTPGDTLLVALAASPMAPMLALFLASQADNKVQGFALMKLSGILLFSPIAAFFIQSNWAYIFGALPTFWPMKVYWILEAGESGVWPAFLLAILYQSFVTWLFLRRFNKVLYQ